MGSCDNNDQFYKCLQIEIIEKLINSALFHIYSLTLISKPQQLSTFALTLFNYKTQIDGKTVSVGKKTKNYFFLLLMGNSF